MDTIQSSTTDDTHTHPRRDQPLTLDYRSANPNSKSSSDFTRKALRGVLIGCVFGILLTAISRLAADHARTGSYTILMIASSPAALIPSRAVLLFGIPLVWTSLAILASTAAHRGCAATFILLMSSHYLANLLLLQLRFLDFGNSRAIDWIGLVVYIAGQMALWTMFVLARRNGKPSIKENRYWIEEL